jgi:AcrR family transcriptional regulator
VTIEGIAARAQVAKQTIYRWWDSKTDILFEALAADAAEYFTTPDHGDLASDLRDHLRQLAVFLADTDAGAVCRALAGQAQHDRRWRPASGKSSRCRSASGTACPSSAPRGAANCRR